MGPDKTAKANEKLTGPARLQRRTFLKAVGGVATGSGHTMIARSS